MVTPPAWARAGTQPLATPWMAKNPAVSSESPNTRTGREGASVRSAPATASRHPTGRTARLPEAVGQPSERDGADGAEGIDQEDQACGTQPQVERGSGQAEAEGVEDGDECSDGAAADGVQRQETPVAQCAPTHDKQRVHTGGRGSEAPGRREQQPHDDGAGQAQKRGRGERPPPSRGLGDGSRQQPPGHPAECGAPDVEPGGASVAGGVQLLAEVRRGDGWEPGERDAREQAEGQQGRPRGSERARRGDHRGGRQGEVDEGGPPGDVGEPDRRPGARGRGRGSSTRRSGCCAAEETPNRSTSSGRIAWVLYSSAKVATPAAKSAPTIRRYAAVPGRWPSSVRSVGSAGAVRGLLMAATSCHRTEPLTEFRTRVRDASNAG